VEQKASILRAIRLCRSRPLVVVEHPSTKVTCPIQLLRSCTTAQAGCSLLQRYSTLTAKMIEHETCYFLGSFQSSSISHHGFSRRQQLPNCSLQPSTRFPCFDCTQNDGHRNLIVESSIDCSCELHTQPQIMSPWTRRKHHVHSRVSCHSSCAGFLTYNDPSFPSIHIASVIRRADRWTDPDQIRSHMPLLLGWAVPQGSGHRCPSFHDVSAAFQ
jgi:hypothetical protein